MKQIDLLLLVFLSLVFTLPSCFAKEAESGGHEMHHNETSSPKDYVIMQSWDHQKQVLLSKGMTETEADTKILDWLTKYQAMDRTAGNDRIGLQAPPFQFDDWLNSGPLTVDDLKGQVVLIRWFTDTCPFCASSAPALRQLFDEYTEQGLKMIGVFHPKAGRDDPLDKDRVARVVEARDFKFPVAIDWDWRNGTLKNWWLTGPKRPGTSVTFILDKSGVIRFVHPGMEYHEDNGAELHKMCANDMGNIKAMIEKLLAD